MTVHPLTRRALVRGTVVVLAGGVAGFVIARGSDAARDAGTTTAANAYGPDPEADAARPLARLADVPDGGGVVLGDEHVVLTRAGDRVVGLSATCTHQGCTVDRVADGVVSCPCHGSTFDAGTGEVVTGPATRALDVVDVEVRDGAVYRTAGG